MITGDPVHARLGQAGATKDIAATDNHGNLDTDVRDRLDLGGNPLDVDRIDTVIEVAHQRLTAQFQEHPRKRELLSGAATRPANVNHERCLLGFKKRRPIESTTANLCHDFFGKVFLFFLDALTNLKPIEGGYSGAGS